MQLVFYFLTFFSLVFSLDSGSPMQHQLVVRADQFNPYKLPSSTRMPDLTPACGENGKLAVRYLHVSDEVKPAVRLFKGEDFVETPLFDSKYVISDLSLFSEGVLFSTNYLGGTDGAYTLGYDGLLTQIIKPSEFQKNSTYGVLKAVSKPEFLGETGQILFRGWHHDGSRVLYLGDRPLLEPQNGVAYVFLPEVKKNDFTVRVNYGESGQVSEKNPDKILLYKDGEFTTVAYDHDFNSKSDFLGFDSRSVPDGDGGVFFVAESKTYGRSLWYFNNGKKDLIYHEQMNMGSLEYFYPAVGGTEKNRKVVFRVIDKNKRRKILMWDKFKIREVLVQGQQLHGNEENLKVIDRKGWPAFSGSSCVTFQGDIYINVVLESAENGMNKGSGIYKFKVN